MSNAQNSSSPTAAPAAPSKGQPVAGKPTGKPRGAPRKKPEEYLVKQGVNAVSLASYSASPATAFLRQVVEAKNSFDYCRRYFPKRAGGNDLSSEAEENLRNITGPLFACLMGHFETFQKFLFAGAVEATRFFKDWDEGNLAALFGERSEISPRRMLAYRGQGAQVGTVLADSLSGWHSPGNVNSYFKAIDSTVSLFSNSDVEDLIVLWQIRHTLVHTGGWLTLPDAQKVKRLHLYGDHSIGFEENFQLALTKRLHRLAKDATGRLKLRLTQRLRIGLPANDQAEFSDLTKCDSPAPAYFS